MQQLNASNDFINCRYIGNLIPMKELPSRNKTKVQTIEGRRQQEVTGFEGLVDVELVREN